MRATSHVRSPRGWGIGSAVTFWLMNRTSTPAVASRRRPTFRVTVPNPVSAASPIHTRFMPLPPRAPGVHGWTRPRRRSPRRSSNIARMARHIARCSSAAIVRDHLASLGDGMAVEVDARLAVLPERLRPSCPVVAGVADEGPADRSPAVDDVAEAVAMRLVVPAPADQPSARRSARSAWRWCHTTGRGASARGRSGRRRQPGRRPRKSCHSG